MVTLLENMRTGELYCPMAGHAEAECDGSDEVHMALIFSGVGTSSVPGPTDAELRSETQADRELMLDEFHGGDID